MWVTIAIMLLILLIGEGMFVLSDKLPWKKKKEEKKRWWDE